jgi:predicted enzyme related to lactoylglutathione lyase
MWPIDEHGSAREIRAGRLMERGLGMMNRLTMLLLAGMYLGAPAALADPSITSSRTGTWDPGQLVWADLLTNDVDAARRFYGDVFGWQFTGDDQYLQASNAGEPVAGIAYHEPRDPSVSEVVWLVSISVEDVDAAAGMVPDAGGTVLEAPQDVAGRGRYAIVEDDQGAVFVMLRSAEGDPPDRRSVDHDWVWGELWTRDTSMAKRFYADVAGYESRDIEDADNATYTVLFNTGKPKTGLVELPWEDVLPHWLPYLRVADIEQTIARIEAAGGAVLLAPEEQYDDGSVAIVSDPTGGVFAIQAPRTAE